MGQDREDERLRQAVARPPRRPPRAEGDPAFQARRQAADVRAESSRRRSHRIALLAFIAFQLVGAGIAASGLHAGSAGIGWALVNIGLLVGNAGSLLSVWYIYAQRNARGDW